MKKLSILIVLVVLTAIFAGCNGGGRMFSGCGLFGGGLSNNAYYAPAPCPCPSPCACPSPCQCSSPCPCGTPTYSQTMPAYSGYSCCPSCQGYSSCCPSCPGCYGGGGFGYPGGMTPGAVMPGGSMPYDQGAPVLPGPTPMPSTSLGPYSP